MPSDCDLQAPESMDCLAVHVFDFDLRVGDRELNELIQVLDEHEVAQAQRFATADLKRKYVASHGNVRHVLGRYLGVSPGEVRLFVGSHGKPSLHAAHASSLRFNLSHSGEKCLLALTLNREVGVDVERVRPLEDWREIAHRFFSNRETARLAELPAHLSEQAFFATWSRKEAYIKALGLGLALDLSSFEVEVDPRKPGQLIWAANETEGPKQWLMCDVDVDPEYRAALAVRDQRCSITTRTFMSKVATG